MKRSVFFLKGPGHHASGIEASLKEVLGDEQIKSVSYYPSFKITSTKGVFYILSGRLYAILTYIIWGLKNRLGWVANYQRHLSILFPLLDFLSSVFYDKRSVLIGWSQISYYSLKKSRLPSLLEHPMIHGEEWNDLIRKEYNTYNDGAVKDSLYSKSMIRRMKREYELATYINVLSTYAASSFLKHGIRAEKIRITLPGIDASFFFPAEKKSNGKFIILYAGRLQFLKGTHHLIEAYDRIATDQTELWLCGNIHDEIKPWLRRNSSIRHIPLQSAEKLRELYWQADLFVLPSVQEAFGLVLLEAMACGVPVIASRNTGAPDVIDHGQNGFLFDSGDIAALAMYISYLLKNPEQTQHIGISARKAVEANFTMAHYEKRFLELFEQLAGNLSE